MVATHNIGLDADDEKYWSTLYHKGDNNFTDSDINLFYFAKNLYRGLKQKDVTSQPEEFFDGYILDLGADKGTVIITKAHWVIVDHRHGRPYKTVELKERSSIEEQVDHVIRVFGKFIPVISG